MEEESIYRTPMALCQDILLMSNGGAMLSDDQPISEREVLYWIAGFVAERYRLEVDKARGMLDLVDRRLWTNICIVLSERPHVRGPHQPLPQLYATACLDENILSTAGSLCLKDVFWGGQQLAALPIATVRQGPSNFSRFGKVRLGWAVEGPTFHASLPFDASNDQPVTALAVLMPDETTIVEHPDEPFTWLPEWNADLRRQALVLLGATMQGLPDTKNNGANLQSDKR